MCNKRKPTGGFVEMLVVIACGVVAACSQYFYTGL